MALRSECYCSIFPRRILRFRQLFPKAAFFSLGQREAQAAGQEAWRSRGPAQTPPRPRPTEETGRLCLLAQSLTGLRDWTGRKCWVGLSTGEEAAHGRDFWGVASGTAPFRGLKVDSGCRGGARTRRPIPTQFFGSRRGAAPRRGRTGTGNCKGHLGLGQAGTTGRLGTTEGIRGPGQL